MEHIVMYALTIQYTLPPPQVPRHARELLVDAHSRARIPCDLHNITSLRWYKDNEVILQCNLVPQTGYLYKEYRGCNIV